MGTGRDTFKDFVTLLSGCLDDHGTTMADLAARLYLSRSQLDRLVAAAAGEPPAQFRRRILLERAAFRLRTSPVTVLTAAVEAGYSSDEAFGRAFRRCYGQPPSVWRSSPGPVLIQAPNNVHFHPPGGLRLPSRKQVSSMDFVSGLVAHHVVLLSRLIDRAVALPDSDLDAPIRLSVEGIDAFPTVRSLLSRLVGQLDMWNRAMADEAYDFGVERDESIDSMRRRLATAGRRFEDYVREVVEQDRFDETFVDTTGDKPYVFTAAGMIGHVLTYAAYRRTLVVGALASAGAPDVDDDPLTWFAPGA